MKLIYNKGNPKEQTYELCCMGCLLVMRFLRGANLRIHIHFFKKGFFCKKINLLERFPLLSLFSNNIEDKEEERKTERGLSKKKKGIIHALKKNITRKQDRP